jgi:PPP family 3-phenylpropionic acid transporter
MTGLAQARAALSPTLRGSLYYLGYWGIVGVYAPFINVHFLRLGLSGGEIGLLSSLLPLVTLLIAPALSAMADARGWRVPILALSVAGLAICLLLLGIPRTFAGLAPLMALMALARSPIAPLGDSLVARMAARYQLDYGQLRMWGSLGFSLVAISCGALWERVGFDMMFVLSGLLFLPVVGAALLLDEGHSQTQRARSSIRDLGRDRTLLALLLASFLVGASIGTDIVFSGIFMDDLGGSELLIGAVLGVSAFSELPGMRYGGALARRLGGPATLLIAYGLLALGFGGMALATQPWMLLGLALFKGLGFALYFVSNVRLMDERVPADRASTIQGLNAASAWGLAPLLAGPLNGVLYDVMGPRAVFAGCALLMILAALVIIVAIGGKRATS